VLYLATGDYIFRFFFTNHKGGLIHFTHLPQSLAQPEIFIWGEEPKMKNFLM